MDECQNDMDISIRNAADKLKEYRDLSKKLIKEYIQLQEAIEQKKSAIEHFTHMLVHGTLHLMGYDHETSDEDAEEIIIERKLDENAIEDADSIVEGGKDRVNNITSRFVKFRFKLSDHLSRSDTFFTM